MIAKPRKPWLANLLLTGALPVLVCAYVFSYPIAMRYYPSPDLLAYRPVQWLIDETPLRAPIYAWSRVCGTEAKVRTSSSFRLLGGERREGLPPP
jgi:hypothetical protein